MTLRFPAVLALLLSGLQAYAQQPNKDFTPQSPEAAALTKMVNYPINLNTGVPEISIPLYTAESGDLKLPISINYHAGGFKINEMSTSVGLGWNLSCDIQITRQINGLDDFTPQIGYLANTKVRTHYDTYGTCLDCDYPLYGGGYPGFNALQLANGGADGMPDKFQYKLLNKSGSFYFTKGNDGTTFFIQPVPFDNIQVQYDNGRFIIIDTDGTTYYFGTAGQVTDIASQGFELAGAISGPKRKSTWKCLKIQNATKTESIDFAYQLKTEFNANKRIDQVTYYYNDNPCFGLISYLNLNNQNAFGNTTYEGLRLHYPFYALSSPKYFITGGDGDFHLPFLTTSNGTNQVNDRVFSVPQPIWDVGSNIEGLALASIKFRGGEMQFNGTDKLSSIVVMNTVNQEIKTIEFISSFTQAWDTDFARMINGPAYNGTLYLDELKFKNGSHVFEKYGFIYNQKTAFGGHLKGSDAWGYFNSSTMEAISSTDLKIPRNSVTQRFYYSTNPTCSEFTDNVIFNIGNPNYTEIPDESGLKRGVLQRVIYPTGGYTDFDFELNKYVELARDGSESSPSYPVIQNGGGLRIRSINFYDGKSTSLKSQKYYQYGEMEDGVGLIMNSPPRVFEPGKKSYNGFNYYQNIFYLRSAEPNPCQNRSCITSFIKEKKTTYLPSSALDYAYANGAPIYYTKVNEYNIDLGKETGKKIYTYYSPFEWDLPVGATKSVIADTNVPYIFSDAMLGALKSQEDYKYENSSFKLQYKKAFNYEPYKKNTKIKVAYGFARNLYQVVSGNVSSYADLYNSSYSFASGSLPTEIDFVAGQYGILSGKPLLSSTIETLIDNGQALTQTTSYYYDNPLYIQPSRIITTNSKGEQLTKSIKYAYDYPGFPIYVQMSSAAVNMISQPIEEILFNNNQSKEISRTKTNYELVNEGFTFIAPVSIQSSKQGSTLETDSYFLYNDKAKVKQVNGKAYTTKSYLWGYNYKYPIAEFDGIDFVTAVSSINVNAVQNITDPVQLRTTLTSLRSANPNALVTTFTYKPLVGVASRTEPDGQNTYFDYDGYGRLATSKDHNQKVVKRYEYNLIDYSISNPMLAYVPQVNTPMMATFRLDCPTSPVTYQASNYILPGGQFSGPQYPSSVYSQAENALYAQGPNIGFGTFDCVPLNQLSTIKLKTFMLSNIPFPSNAYLDLLQDGNISGSQKFPYYSPNTLVNQFYMKNGTYKLSFRQDAIPGGALIKYFITPSTGSAFWKKNGEELTFLPGVTYDISITNAF